MRKVASLTKNQVAAFIDKTAKAVDNYRLWKQKFGRIKNEQLLLLMPLYEKGQEIFGST